MMPSILDVLVSLIESMCTVDLLSLMPNLQYGSVKFQSLHLKITYCRIDSFVKSNIGLDFCMT